MRFQTTRLPGAYLIELEPIVDARGSFARTFCQGEFRAQGLVHEFVQCNIAYNARVGTLRGLHYTQPPHDEVKLVRCTRGRLYDVMLDLRSDSPSYGHWFAVELAPDSDRMLYVPAGVAHGYQTLADDTEVSYWMSRAYRQGVQNGVRWDDPAFGIHWPVPRPILSRRDRGYPNFVAG